MTTTFRSSDPVKTSETTSVQAIELPRYRKGHDSKQDDDQIIASDAAIAPSPTVDPTLSTRRVVRTLIFRRPILVSDITVYSPTPDTNQETPIYHAQTYEWNITQPDIVFYAGDQPSPTKILAVSRFRWSRDARMGYGSSCLDPNATDTQWEDMKNTSKWLAHYQYDFAVPSQTSHQRRRFRWVRTNKVEDGVEGWSGYLSLRNAKLIDVETEEVVGVFLADNLRSLTKKGELRLFEALAKEVEVAVVLSMCTICEKATRRGRAEKQYF